MGKRRTVFFRELVPSNFFLRDSVFLRCGTKQFRASQVGQRVIGAVRQKREEEVLLCLTHCASSSACTVLPSQLEMPPEKKLASHITTTARDYSSQTPSPRSCFSNPLLANHLRSLSATLFPTKRGIQWSSPLLCKQKLPSLSYGGRVHTK